MKLETFKRRLESGKGVSCIYLLEGKENAINIWKYENKFVLTWEECPEGEFYNEDLYSRDEVHHFESVDEIILFLRKNSVAPECFVP